MPSYSSTTNDRNASSPMSSTLAYAASLALPASRAPSPGMSPNASGRHSTLPRTKGTRGDQRDRAGYGSGHRWDDAWDSGSDEDVPAGPSGSRSQSSAAVPIPRSKPTPKHTRNGESNMPSSSSTMDSGSPEMVTRPTAEPKAGNGPAHGNNNAPLTILTRSFSYTHISPPSPSSYDNKSNGYLPPKAEWQVLETGEIVEAEQSYGTTDSGKGGMDGFGNDWVPEKKKSEIKSPSLSAASLVSSAFGFSSARWKGKDKEKPAVATIFNPVPEEKQKPREKIGKEALRSDIEDILRDPLHTLKVFSQASIPATPGSNAGHSHDDNAHGVDLSNGPFGADTASFAKAIGRTRSGSIRTERKRERFAKVLRGRGSERGGGVDPTELRKMAWAGIPEELRPIAWQMLLNYLPLPTQPRLATLQRKRKEYAHLVNQAFGRGMTTMDAQIWHQIEIDVPRTRPGVPLWACEVTQRSLERILYVWAIRHPASGYVQGINDLVTPFFEVFLSAYVELFDTTQLPANILAAIEADSFWCLSKLLDGIQDNYISAQPGIHRQVKRMAELVKRIDCPLAMHMDEQGVEYMQFAFRWMNCLLMREISVKCTIRMWDTYLAEGTDAFSQFHLYVCSAFLVKWSEKLQKMDFQEIIMFLQRLPTDTWKDHDVELLLSEAFVLKSVWQGAENHFNGGTEGPLGGGMGGR